MVHSHCNQLHLGSCVEGLNKLDSRFPGIDLAFADPPYNIGYSYDVYKDNLDDKAYLDWTESWMAAVNRVLKPTGAFWVASGDEYVAEIKQIGDKLGLYLRNWVIWYYTFGVHCTKKFSRSHTHLLYFVKDPKKVTFNDGDIRVRSARQLVYNDGRADPRGRVPDNTWILRPQDASGAFSSNHDTWYFARVAGTFKERAGFHSCQMPERLLERIVRCSSNPDDVVLDPFAGSGSTLIVAKKLGRQWLGYDTSPDYVRHATARIAAVRVGDPIEGPEDALSSAPPTPFGSGSRNEAVDERGILEAFKQASDGYSADWVVADPVLNVEFVDQCSKRGLNGRPSDWNLMLFRMRKASKLGSIPTTKRRQVSWQSMDPFAFASEIALRRMQDLGYPSLDHVLCDPIAATRFDDLARSLAPGFCSWEYRWAALRLRKAADRYRQSSKNVLDHALLNNWTKIPLNALAFEHVEQISALYWLAAKADETKPVYVGLTLDLAKRSELHRLPALDRFIPNSGEWILKWRDVNGRPAVERRGLQSLLIGKHRPAMNYLELADLKMGDSHVCRTSMP